MNTRELQEVAETAYTAEKQKTNANFDTPVLPSLR